MSNIYFLNNNNLDPNDKFGKVPLIDQINNLCLRHFKLD